MQYCARDMEQGFKENGHETRFLIEENDVQSLCPQFYLKEVKDFNPDLFFTVSHCRASYPFMPKELPMISYMQDKCGPIVGIQDLRPYIEEHDLLICSMREFHRYFRKKQVPERQLMILPPPASPSEFYPLPNDKARKEELHLAHAQ